MSLTLMFALQATAAPAPALLEIDFDLARYEQQGLGLPGRACHRGGDDAIVVCGRRGAGTYPLEEMARIFEPGRLVAETRLIGNVTAGVYVESAPALLDDRGATSNRVVVGLRLPF